MISNIEMIDQNPQVSYGIKTIKSIRRTNKNVSAATKEIINKCENYFATTIDHLIGRCITYLLCTYPDDILMAMLLYFTKLKHGEDSFISNVTEKPKIDQKILLATRIGPVISKLVNKMIAVRPTDPIQYILDEISVMLEEQSKSISVPRPTADLTDEQLNEDSTLTSHPIVERPQTAPMRRKSKILTNQRTKSLFNMSPSPEDLDDTDGSVEVIEDDVTDLAIKVVPPAKVLEDKSNSVDSIEYKAAIDEVIAVEPVPVAESPEVLGISTESPGVSENVPEEKVINIVLLGLGKSGKTTILNSIQGEVDGKCKPTIGFRPVSLELDSCTKINFFDVGGDVKIRDIWPDYFHDVHGIIYVFDSSCELVNSDNFEDAAKIFHNSIRHKLLLDKPLLVFLNKQDIECVSGTEIMEKLELKDIPQHIQISECTGLGINDNNGVVPDPRIETHVEWLIGKIMSDYDSINKRVISDSIVKKKEDLNKKLMRERKVLKNRIITAFSSKIDPALLPNDFDFKVTDNLELEEGLEFLSSEIGESTDQLPELARDIASLVGYQRLALQIIGALKSPVSKKKVPMSWEEIHSLIIDIRSELGL